MDRRAFFGLPFALWSATRPAYASGHNPNCEWRDKNGIFRREQRIIIQGQNLEFYKSHRQEALATGEAQTVLVDKVEGYKLALQDIRNGNLPPGSVTVFDLSRNPDIALASLDKPVKRVIIYHNVPETLDEARNVHGFRKFGEVDQEGYSDDELQREIPGFVEVARQLTAIGAIKIHSSGTQNAAKWLEQAVSSHGNDELVIIMSHIVQYGIEKITPGGSPFIYPAALLPLTDGSIYKPNIPSTKSDMVWLVGCETWDLNMQLLSLNLPALTLGAQVTYPVAFDIVKETTNGSSIREIINHLQRRRFRLPPPRIQPETTDSDGHPLQLRRPPAVSAVAQMYEGNVLVVNAVV